MIYQGYNWPDDDKDAHWVIMAEAERAVPAFLDLVTGRGLVIQAGGNVGVYPNRLREHFSRVITAEPDRVNFRCMMQNLRGDVEVKRAAFGAEPGHCGIRVVSPGNCGAHRIDPSLDGMDVITIDSLGMAPDAVWLDIEGFEYFALKGAEQTLRQHKPVVVIEEKGLGETYGIRPEDCGEYLKDMGYSKVARIGNDNVYKVTE